MTNSCDFCGAERHGGSIYCLACRRAFAERRQELEDELERTFFIYGPWDDKNGAIVIKAPVTKTRTGNTKFVNGPALWRAVGALAKSLYPPRTKLKDRPWYVDGEPPPYLGTKRLWERPGTRRFIWDGVTLNEVG